MKKLEFKTSGLFLILLMTFFIIGCASEPVKIDLPANHPSKPEAQEAEFNPPPNPFQQDATAMKGESTPDSMMKHKMPEESSKQHMGHDMETKKENQSDSESNKKSNHGENDNQHKGHGQ